MRRPRRARSGAVIPRSSAWPPSPPPLARALSCRCTTTRRARRPSSRRWWRASPSCPPRARPLQLDVVRHRVLEDPKVMVRPVVAEVRDARREDAGEVVDLAAEEALAAALLEHRAPRRVVARGDLFLEIAGAAP